MFNSRTFKSRLFCGAAGAIMLWAFWGALVPDEPNSLEVDVPSE